jgi:hypothetical protein
MSLEKRIRLLQCSETKNNRNEVVVDKCSEEVLLTIGYVLAVLISACCYA